jgi:hypothetical protein
VDLGVLVIVVRSSSEEDE